MVPLSSRPASSLASMEHIVLDSGKYFRHCTLGQPWRNRPPLGPQPLSAVSLGFECGQRLVRKPSKAPSPITYISGSATRSRTAYENRADPALIWRCQDALNHMLDSHAQLLPRATCNFKARPEHPTTIAAPLIISCEKLWYRSVPGFIALYKRLSCHNRCTTHNSRLRHHLRHQDDRMQETIAVAAIMYLNVIVDVCYP